MLSGLIFDSLVSVVLCCLYNLYASVLLSFAFSSPHMSVAYLVFILVSFCAPTLSLSHIPVLFFLPFGSADLYSFFPRIASCKTATGSMCCAGLFFSGVMYVWCACTHSGIYPDNVSVLVLCSYVFYMSVLNFWVFFCDLRFYFLLTTSPVLSPPIAFAPKMAEGQSAICTQPLPYHTNSNVLEGLLQHALIKKRTVLWPLTSKNTED